MSKERPVQNPIDTLSISPGAREILKRMQQRPQGLHLQSLQPPKEPERKEKKPKRKRRSVRKLLLNNPDCRRIVIEVLENGGSFGDATKALTSAFSSKKGFSKNGLVSLADRLCRKKGIKKKEGRISRMVLLEWLRSPN
ncbi:hypothetical protein COU15_01960 [Candidatus Kaiserbacteria bacterium CG10_big_fil_rev_8_21_14_0_10_45_20]|uniref:Uncharacterized protein n=1 Tax=Candidatus Kaiserbacteria bacterium CG10_big_fil_rev_8_21_14_0_10_45_20 TaxID=1974607 RepID=A0A2H0UFH3_9BACT|nr:MAG: hypothetical protein COU15_01960 [Candidatus Kaiserbacteria bacterium CG10_big_fil_rev_8_21_14_0_10_45_20]